MVNRGEEKVRVHMNVVPRSTGNTNRWNRELTLKCKFKCYLKCHYDQILDIHCFTFSDTIGLSQTSCQISICYER